MSVFHNDPTDAWSKRRSRYLRFGDKRAKDRTHSGTANNRLHGKADKGNPNKKMRFARQTAVV